MHSWLVVCVGSVKKKNFLHRRKQRAREVLPSTTEARFVSNQMKIVGASGKRVRSSTVELINAAFRFFIEIGGENSMQLCLRKEA